MEIHVYITSLEVKIYHLLLEGVTTPTLACNIKVTFIWQVTNYSLPGMSSAKYYVCTGSSCTSTDEA